MKLAFDIETNGLLDKLDRIHSLVIRDVETGKQWSCCDQKGFESIAKGLSLLSEAGQLIGHNIAEFDIPAIKKVYPDWTYKGRVIDTLPCSKLIWTNLKELDFTFRRRNPEFPGNLIGRHSLEAWGQRLKCLKGDYAKEMKAKGLDPWANWNPLMQEYCENDVEVTCQFWEKIKSKNYSDEAIILEHEFREIIARQEKSGFVFDIKAAELLYAQLQGRATELELELQDIFPPRVEVMKTPAYYTYRGGKYSSKKEADIAARSFAKKNGLTIKSQKEFVKAGPMRTREHPFKPSSGQQIAERLIEKYEWKPQEFTEGGDPVTSDKILSKLDYPEIPLLCEYLMLDKRLGQLANGKQAWLTQVKADGRIHGRVNTLGAVTGRCTHSNPNVAQVPAVGVPFGKECRSLFGVPEDYLLLGCDASGLELRCLAHFMANWDNGDYANVVLDGDIHTVNQEAAGLPTRALAKRFIYAFLYGCGDELLGEITGSSKQAGARLRAKFLQNIPALGSLIEAVKKAAGFVKGRRGFWSKGEKFRGWIYGLDKRRLHIRSAHAALNTLLQSAGALVMKKALIILEGKLKALDWKYDEDYFHCANVHDEFQIAVRPHLSEKLGELAVKSIREAGDYFGFRCPLDGEYKVGKTWAETH